MTHYILQTLVFQLLFLVVYDVFLKRETFFNWNRSYLLLSSLLSLLLPLVKISSLQQIIPSQYIFVLPEVIIGNNNSTELATGFQMFDLWTLVFLVGLVLSALLLLIKCFKLYRLERSGQVVYKEGYRFVYLPKTTMAFSYLGTIFLGESLSEQQQQTIIKHELVHIKERHSLDLIYFELLRIVFWFNPLLYGYQKRMVELQEFIADAEATVSKDKKDYYQELLSQVFKSQNISFINPFFNHSLIKKRIIMLQKSKSQKKALLKYLLILPLLLSMLLYNACTQEEIPLKQQGEETILQKVEALKVAVEQGLLTKAELNELSKVVLKTKLKDISLNNENVFEEEIEYLDDMPFAMIEKAPVFQGCTGDNATLKRCMSEKIMEHVQKGFNTDLAGSLGLSGRQRISVAFKIDANGNVVNVRARASHQRLSDEAIRVVKTLPKFTPGEQKGRKIGVMYALPILFMVE